MFSYPPVDSDLSKISSPEVLPFTSARISPECAATALSTVFHLGSAESQFGKSSSLSSKPSEKSVSAASAGEGAKRLNEKTGPKRPSTSEKPTNTETARHSVEILMVILLLGRDPKPALLKLIRTKRQNLSFTKLRPLCMKVNACVNPSYTS